MIAWYIEYEYWVAAVQLVLAMLGMGAGLQIADFKNVAMQPKAASIGLLMQLIVVPLVALGFIVLTNLPSGMVIGMAIVASIPGGYSLQYLYLYGAGQCASLHQYYHADFHCLPSHHADNFRLSNI